MKRTEAIALSGVTKRYSGVTALDDVSLSLPSGVFAAILGPSGCGKSSILQVIAGLVKPDWGEVRIQGIAIGAEIPPEGRCLGMVFQAPTLFPHMTVYENVAFSLRVRGTPGGKIAAAVGDLLSLAGLSASATALPGTLSGGQQQRVALCRALVFRPSIVLLDEPLSALDRPLREVLQLELRRLQRMTQATFLMVTHDREEAMAIADIVVVMRDGRVEQVGPPSLVYRAPASAFVAEFFASSAVVAGTVQANDGGWCIVTGDGLTLHAAQGAAPAVSVLEVVVRPEHVRVCPLRAPRPSPPFSHLAQVEDIRFAGATTILTLLSPSGRFLARVPAEATSDFTIGDQVEIGIDAETTVLLPPGRQ